MGSEILLVVLLAIAGAVIFWIILKISADRIAAQYRLLAERFGLELNLPPARMSGFVRPDPTLYGEYRDREVSFSAPGKGIKNTRQIETLLKVGLKNRVLRAQLVASGPLGGLRQRHSGGQARWKSGDEAFDKAVDARTNQATTLAEVLTGERRVWLADTLRKSKAMLTIRDGVISYAELGMIADDATREKLQGVVEFLCDLAEDVES